MLDVQTIIQEQLNQNKVVLYMKGTPQFPQCGFSGKAVSILKACGVSFKFINVLEDTKIREGIKVFGNWPTIPQLYVNGKLIGGCDIVSDLYEQGKIKALLDE